RVRATHHPAPDPAAHGGHARPLRADRERRHALARLRGGEGLRGPRLLVGVGRLAADVVLHVRDQPAHRRDRTRRVRARPPDRPLMRYESTPEQLAWRDEVRRFLRQAVTPALRAEMRQAGNEGDGPLAREFHRKLFDKGWWGIGWPKEHGGLGRSAIDQFIFVEEMEKAGAPAMQLTIRSVAPTILRAGSEEQKARWLPPILRRP